MLEAPDLPDHALAACLRDAYGLRAAELAFLPLGYHATAAYRVVADAGTPYFLKLRRGAFDAATVLIPHFLRARGVTPIIPPIATRTGQLWTQVADFTAVLYPFVAGQTGFQRELSDRHWIELGATLRAMHAAVLPASLRRLVPSEAYRANWRRQARTFQTLAREATFLDPIAAQTAALLNAHADEIARLVEGAERLGRALGADPPVHVLCHADLHANNVLLGDDGALYLVDWENLSFAPKERDLMFIGAGIGGRWHQRREAELFYQGYGPTAIDPAALAYYRCERIVVDIAEFGEQLLLSQGPAADRARGLQKLADAFRPSNVVAIALASHPASRAE